MKDIKSFVRRLYYKKDARVMTEIAAENIKNLYYVCWFIVAVEIFGLVTYLPMPDKDLRTILYVAFCIIGCSSIAVVAKKMKTEYETQKIISTRLVNLVIVLFYLIMTIWAIMVDGIHYMNGSQMLTFYIVQFCFGVFILLYPRLGTIVFTLGFASFYAVLYWMDGAAQMQLQNLVIFLLVMIAGGHIRFLSKYKEILESDARHTVSEEMLQMKTYEKKVNEGIKLSLEAENPEDNINMMLRYLGELFGGDRVYIFEKNERNEDDNTFEWCAEGVDPQIDFLQNVAPEICELWYRIFRQKKAVVIQNIEEIRESDPLVYETLKPQEVTSLVSYALYDKKKAIGFFGIDNPSAESLNITEDIMEIISNFLVSLIRKRNLVRELQRLSFTDAVTGADNRFAMYAYFETIKNDMNAGVLFCDITGLKEVNDTQGHSAGDALIQTTYQCLRRGFRAEQIFRVGGDEFVVLCSEIDEEVFYDRVRAIRSDLQEKQLVVAIGVEFLSHVAETIDKTTEEAEKRMYEEKRTWYKQNGKERRQQ